MSTSICSSRAGKTCALAVALVAASAPACALNLISDWRASNGVPGIPWEQAGSASLSGGGLTISTPDYASNAYFIESDSSSPGFATAAGVSIEASVRFVSGSYVAGAPRDSIVVGVTQGDNWGNGLFIGDGRIFLLADNWLQGASAAVDTRGFHTYRIDVGARNGNTASSFDVYYDGSLMLSGSTYSSAPGNGSAQSVYWGEGSIYAAGVSEWAFVRNASQVPEPVSGLLILAGLGLLASVARRQGT